MTWTDAEIDAVITLYLSMAASAYNRRPYNKAAMIREYRGESHGDLAPHFTLGNRTKGSIEAKLMNVTAAVELAGRDDLSMSDYGYRPLANMQKALRERVAERGCSANRLR